MLDLNKLQSQVDAVLDDMTEESVADWYAQREDQSNYPTYSIPGLIEAFAAKCQRSNDDHNAGS